MKNFVFNVLALAGIALMSVSHVAFAAPIVEKLDYKAEVNGTALENQIYEICFRSGR